MARSNQANLLAFNKYWAAGCSADSKDKINRQPPIQIRSTQFKRQRQRSVHELTGQPLKFY